MEKPTIVFFGTPHFAVHVLDELENANLTPDVVVTQPDKPAGRGLALTQSPVKAWALTRDIPVLEPKSLKKESEALDFLKNSEWDLFLVAAYGKILPKDILDLPQKGVLNVHPSLLPRFRGASPVESQILADEREVGVSIMLMDEEMDHGPVLAAASITPEQWPLKASILEPLLAQAGGELLAETIPAWLAGDITPEEQEHDRATYTSKIMKENGHIEITRHPMSGKDEYCKYLKFCAYDGWPGVFFMYEKNSGQKIRVKITDAEYKNGVFMPLTVIPEGKKETPYENFLQN